MRFVFLFSVLACGCVSTDGGWVPFTDVHDDKEVFMDKFGVPKPEQVFEGMMFWELSPFINEPPLSFWWNDKILTLWVPNGQRLNKEEIAINDCPGLKAAVDELLASVAETARMMTDDKVWVNVPVVLDPTFYQIKYFPEDMMGSISLRGIDADQVPWIPAAKNVVRLSKACSKS